MTREEYEAQLRQWGFAFERGAKDALHGIYDPPARGSARSCYIHGSTLVREGKLTKEVVYNEMPTMH